MGSEELDRRNGIRQPRNDAYLPRLRSFQDRRPHKSMKFQVSAKDIDNLIDYILNLKLPKRPR